MSKTKTKKEGNESIKKVPLNLLKENDDVNITVNSAHNSHATIVIIRCYEDIIKTQNKKAIAYITK